MSYDLGHKNVIRDSQVCKTLEFRPHHTRLLNLTKMVETTSSDENGMTSQPMNVEQIVQKAQSYDYNPLIPLKYWLRTAGTLLKEVL